MTELNATANATTRKPTKYPEGFTFDAKQTSKMLGISRAQLKRLQEKGVITPVVTRGTTRTSSLYDPASVDQLVALGGVQHLVTHRANGVTGMGGSRLARIEGLLRQLLERLDEFQLRPPTGK